MKSFTITLDTTELNTVLSALGQQPYVTVVNLIAKLQVQAQAQIVEADAKSDGE